jgi:hypothetical protein
MDSACEELRQHKIERCAIRSRSSVLRKDPQIHVQLFVAFLPKELHRRILTVAHNCGKQFPAGPRHPNPIQVPEYSQSSSCITYLLSESTLIGGCRVRTSLAGRPLDPRGLGRVESVVRE